MPLQHFNRLVTVKIRRIIEHIRLVVGMIARSIRLHKVGVSMFQRIDFAEIIVVAVEKPHEGIEPTRSG